MLRFEVGRFCRPQFEVFPFPFKPLTQTVPTLWIFFPFFSHEGAGYNSGVFPPPVFRDKSCLRSSLQESLLFYIYIKDFYHPISPFSSFRTQSLSLSTYSLNHPYFFDTFFFQLLSEQCTICTSSILKLFFFRIFSLCNFWLDFDLIN